MKLESRGVGLALSSALPCSVWPNSLLMSRLEVEKNLEKKQAFLVSLLKNRFTVQVRMQAVACRVAGLWGVLVPSAVKVRHSDAVFVPR